MPTFEVLEAAEARRWKPDDGDELAVVHLTLKQGDQRILASAFRKPDQLPKPGDVLEGELGDNDRFDRDRRKFKSARKGRSNGGYRQRDPKETARIERMHHQDMALHVVDIKARLGVLPEGPDGKQNFDLSDVFTIADAFARDLEPPPPQSDLPFDESQ